MIRTFQQLSSEEQKKANEKCLDEILQGIIEGYIGFEEIENLTLQLKIKEIIKDAELEKQPFLAAEILMQDSFVKKELTEIAEYTAIHAVYPAFDDIVIHLNEI